MKSMHCLEKLKQGMALRAEGVPAHNFIGDDLGFRRPVLASP